MTESEISTLIARDGLALPPLRITQENSPLVSSNGDKLDAVFGIEWNRNLYRFGVEYKPNSTPRTLQTGIFQAKQAASAQKLLPMLITPYLSEAHLRQLEQEGVSGIDLCGNGVVQVPGELLVFRTGAPNKFPHSAPIKNVYRGDSSIVARVFLLKPEYNSVKEIEEEIRMRGALLNNSKVLGKVTSIQIQDEIKVALSTTSKVLKVLEEDLIVGRQSGKIRLLQPEKLLDKLVANYQPPKTTARLHGRFIGAWKKVTKQFYDNAGSKHIRWSAAGIDSISVNQHAVMERGRNFVFYCTDIKGLIQGKNGENLIEETSRFPDVEIIETKEQTAYFDVEWDWDSVNEYHYPLASHIQTYLELMTGDKRDRDTAAQLRETCELLKDAILPYTER